MFGDTGTTINIGGGNIFGDPDGRVAIYDFPFDQFGLAGSPFGKLLFPLGISTVFDLSMARSVARQILSALGRGDTERQGAITYLQAPDPGEAERIASLPITDPQTISWIEKIARWLLEKNYKKPGRLTIVPGIAGGEDDPFYGPYVKPPKSLPNNSPAIPPPSGTLPIPKPRDPRPPGWPGSTNVVNIPNVPGDSGTPPVITNDAPGANPGGDSEVATDWGEWLNNTLQDILAAEIAAKYGGAGGGAGINTTPAGLPGALGGLGLGLGADAGLDALDNFFAPKKKCRRRRRRLLTPTDLGDLAQLKALVGNGESMKIAVMKAIRR